MPLPDWLAEHRDYLHYLPFVGMVAGQRAADRPLLTRTIENGLTAVLAAGLVMWRNDSLQDYKLETIQATVRDIRTDSRAELAQLRSDVAALRLDIAAHTAAEAPQPRRPQKR